MRLIDVDELDKKLFNDGFFGGLSGALNGHKIRRKFTIGEIRDMIKKAPVIEVVNHGEKGVWNKEKCQGDYGRCSLCDCRIPWIPKNYTYCPKCGAYMKED